jgi:hypothetical protein
MVLRERKQSSMTIWQVILVALEVLLEVWKNRNDPELAKLRAAAVATKELNDDIDSFNKAIKEQDAAAISAHFELLRRRIDRLPS